MYVPHEGDNLFPHGGDKTAENNSTTNVIVNAVLILMTTYYELEIAPSVSGETLSP
jgi:hypothetical protein